jgi:hypothetical protein
MAAGNHARNCSSRWGGTLAGLVVVVLSQLTCVRTSLAVVLNFDDVDFDTILSGGSYGGLDWEYGNAGLLGYPGVWVVPSIGGNNYPHSAPHNIVNGNGSTSIGIGFPSAVDVSGAYVAVQGNAQTAWTQNLVVHGYRAGQAVVATTPFTTITTTPAWFDMSVLTNVDRILFEASPPFLNQSYFGMDDLTFTYIPEPAGVSLLALGALVLRRNRR